MFDQVVARDDLARMGRKIGDQVHDLGFKLYDLGSTHQLPACGVDPEIFERDESVIGHVFR